VRHPSKNNTGDPRAIAGFAFLRTICKSIGVDMALKIEGDIDRFALSLRFASPDSLIVSFQGG
jgi:hypothetical protein